MAVMTYIYDMAPSCGRIYELVRLRFLAVCISAALLLISSACSGPEMSPVTGKVTIGGQPVTRGTVAYIPADSKDTSGKTAVGDIKPDGTYTLKTPRQGDGAVVGRYIVSVRGRGLNDAEHMPPNRQVPVRFATARQSGLTAEVKAGTNEIDFNLQ